MELAEDCTEDGEAVEELGGDDGVTTDVDGEGTWVLRLA